MGIGAPISPPELLDPELQKQVYASEIGRVPPSSAADPRSFFIAIHRCCTQWLQGQTDTEGIGATAFVLSERLDVDPVYDAHATEFVQADRLDQGPPTVIPGPILLVSNNLRLCYARSSADTKVAGLVDELLSLGLGDRPSAIFVPNERALYFYQAGVGSKPSFLSEPEAIRGLNISDLGSIIDKFHEIYTRFPDGAGNCWHSATDRLVNKNAEIAIRNSLFTFLAFVVFRTDYIVREHQLPNGRVDIFIFGVALNSPRDHRVLELKVLRSRPSTWKKGDPNRPNSRAFMKAYSERGVRQASRYRDATCATEAHLICFDAQLEDIDLDVEAYAAARNVIHRRLFMESSTKNQ
jgi:hypothetical protein